MVEKGAVVLYLCGTLKRCHRHLYKISGKCFLSKKKGHGLSTLRGLGYIVYPRWNKNGMTLLKINIWLEYIRSESKYELLGGGEPCFGQAAAQECVAVVLITTHSIPVLQF